jgi:hypothetical protein
VLLVGHVQHGNKGVGTWWKKRARHALHEDKAGKRHKRNRVLVVYCDECLKKRLHRLKGKWWVCEYCEDKKPVGKWEK